MKKPCQILLVDDHKLFLDGLQTIINKSEKYEVVNTALNGIDAIDFLNNNKVNIVVADINMPNMSGTELTRVIKNNWPETKVLILSMYNDREIINKIIMAEAEGYILKNSGKQELTTALDKICGGGTYFSNEVINIISQDQKHNNIEPGDDDVKRLTSRETEILKLVCQELSTTEIAKELSISPLTVETHRKNILRKTKKKTIVGLIKFAIHNKLA